MTAKTVTILIASFLILGSLAFIASADQTNDSDKYTFANYGGEEFTPEPMQFGENLGTKQQSMVRTCSTTMDNGTGRKHLWLQFYETPNEEQLELLEDYGVQRVAVAARRTLTCSMPSDMTAADLPAESGLRWMGEIPVENKYDYNYGLNVPSWARTENGKVKLAIRFYEDVISQDSTSILEKYSDNFSASSSLRPWDYETITNESNITLIASEDAVQLVGYYGAQVEPAYDSDFLDDEEITDEDIDDDSIPANEQEINVSDTENGLDSKIKKSPSFSAMMTIVFLILSVVIYQRK
ncbi:hypothetical protein [Methanolobus sp.]|uniref:hypothetical protein n=1 Tax=Methanolobus sp. TaxID=1874737 RepID=UPI0025D7C92F|nr:hypothetical protein [Methanolobus sp.]